MNTIRRYPGEQRRTWKLELEESAIASLAGHLRALGEDVEVLANRPEATSNGLPDVDYELLYRGRSVGVEITQLIPAARSHYEISALERRLQQELGQIPVELDLGLIIVDISFGHLPSRAKIDADVAALSVSLRDALMSWRDCNVRELTVAIPSGFGTVRRLRLIRNESSEARLAFVTGSSEWGGALQPMAAEFLDHLLDTKPAQTGRWDEAWILIQDRIGLIGWDDLLDALPARRDRIPRNWKRMYYLPAAQDVAIVDLLDARAWADP
jgi:hypothetical protein